MIILRIKLKANEGKASFFKLDLHGNVLETSKVKGLKSLLTLVKGRNVGKQFLEL